MSGYVADFSAQVGAEQARNPVSTGFDAVGASRLLESIAASWPERDQLFVLLLRALALLSVQKPDEAVEGFTSLDLAEMVGEVRKRRWSNTSDPDKTSQDVRKQWQKLLKEWKAKKEGVQQRFQNERLIRVPELAKTEGGGSGHMSRYRIEWRAFDSAVDDHPEPLLGRAPSPSQTLTYVCEDVSDAGWMALLFARGYAMVGWRRWLLLAAVLVPLAATLLLLVVATVGLTQWSRFGTPVVLQAVASLLIVVLATWMTIGPLLHVGVRRIVVAPWWMQDFEDSRLLEQRYPPRYRMKALKAVRYTAACTVCGGRVTARGGGLEFWGRIVGRCTDAPVEHVFSFDHVTRSGTTLRR